MTRALIFAAGFGKRLSPLTDNMPKPLVPVNGKPLIQYHIENLVRAGVTEMVINTHWLAEQLVEALGDGAAWGANIQWSHEPEILDTGGGMKKALPLLGAEPFLVVNSDTWTDYPFRQLLNRKLLDSGAHLVMVPNPEHHPQGDFELDERGRLVSEQGLTRYTYAGLGLYSPEFIAGFPHQHAAFPLLEPLKTGIAEGCLTAEIYRGEWHDIGTIARLDALRSRLAS